MSDEDIERQALERVSDLLALDGATRDKALEQLHTESPEIAAAVQALLAHMDASDLHSRASGHGDVLGAWRLLDRIGQGGMGEVHVAERVDGAFEKRVAIKRVWAGIGKPGERFLRERQLLAGLVHPNIAQLVDGGVTTHGQPWFAMELVEGAPITAWCDTRQLGLVERVGVFRQVCDAVAFAHRHLVVHRDIKPGNVLVDDEGRAKLLDFGIARLLDEADPEQTQTLTMTPAWASPEQRAGAAVTTGSDIYQLGVLLRMLLCGDPGTPDNRGQRMSTASATPEQLRAALRGDLDAIVLRATRDVPTERYASVDALSDDLARWLAHRPLLGARESPGARLRKFVRRNRIVVGVAALALVCVGVAGAYAWQKRQQQLREARVVGLSNRVSDEILGQLKPDRLQGRTPDAQTLLDGVVARLPVIRADYADDPVAVAAMQSLIGNKYMDFGRYDKAAPLLLDSLRGLRAERTRFPDIHSKTVNYAAFSLKELHRVPEARALVEAELALRTNERDADPIQTAALWRTEAELRSSAGDGDGADAALRNGLAALAGLHTLLAQMQHSDLTCERGLAFSIARKNVEAEATMQACLRERRALPADEQSLTGQFTTLGTLGDIYNRTARPQLAEDSYRKAMDGLEKHVGMIHPRTSLFRMKWSVVATANGHPLQAIQHLQSAQAAMAAPGADPVRRAREQVALAQAQLVALRPDAALASLALAQPVMTGGGKVEDEFRWQYQQALAVALQDSGDCSKALPAFAESTRMATQLMATAKTAKDREGWKARQASDASQSALCRWQSGQRSEALAVAANAWLDARKARTSTQRIQQRTHLHWSWLHAMSRRDAPSLAAFAALRDTSPEQIPATDHPNAWRFDLMADEAAHTAAASPVAPSRVRAAHAGIAALAGRPDPPLPPGLSVF
ncbi:MAG: serine/threonine protein kinase [Xanthomonadales bacterium]|nr:serine/threonine protein kinase [Xanthomonadales bacterium]